jgi:hypothetical protein
MIFTLVSPVYAATTEAQKCWEGAEMASDGVATIQGITCVLQNLLSPIPALIALVAIGMIIMAGIRIINAGSDPKALASAWATFTYALIGLILLAVVWLVLILIKNFTGADVTNFQFQ